MLSELIYASEVRDDLGTTEVKEILAVSQRNNARDRVTGALIFNSRYFLQWLEGERADVTRVYNRIAADNRHTKAVILCYQDAVCRQFPNWSMGYMGEGVINRELLFKYSSGDAFAPHAMSAPSARAFMLEVEAASMKLSGS